MTSYTQQRKGGIIFALAVGLIVAFISYRWVTDPGPREERARQEAAVQTSRTELVSFVAAGPLEIVDPLAPRRRVGRVYIYPLEAGWEVSGYYRRGKHDLWHPYLVVLDSDLQLVSLKLSEQDPEVVQRASQDDRVDVLP